MSSGSTQTVFEPGVRGRSFTLPLWWSSSTFTDVPQRRQPSSRFASASGDHFLVFTTPHRSCAAFLKGFYDYAPV